MPKGYSIILVKYIAELPRACTTCSPQRRTDLANILTLKLKGWDQGIESIPISTGARPARPAMVTNACWLKQLMCSNGATGFNELRCPFGAFQSATRNLRLTSQPLGTAILINPPGFKDCASLQRVSSGVGMCSKTCSELMNVKLGSNGHRCQSQLTTLIP